MTSYRADKPNFLEFWVKIAKMTLKVRMNDLHFQYQYGMHVWCKFGDSSPNLWWVIVRTSQISWNSESKWPKRHWRSRSMTFIFNTSREYHMMHVWCKFGDPSSNMWRVIVRTRASLRTDRRMGGQMDRRRQRQYPFGLKGQGVKMILENRGIFWYPK